jgi:hypothetical protein
MKCEPRERGVSMSAGSVTPPALPQTLDRARVHVLARRQRRRPFDIVDQGWLLRFLEHRIGDTRILRLVAGLSRA